MPSVAGKNKHAAIHVIGLIADTHGLMRPQALETLKGSDLIVHAGDIGKPEVIESLKALCPVRAIKGNNDAGAWAKALPETESIESGAVRLFVIHNVKELDGDPSLRGYQVVISGHSHKPSVSNHQGVLYVNPGSAGPRRFKLPVAVAKLCIRGSQVKAEIIELIL